MPSLRIPRLAPHTVTATEGRHAATKCWCRNSGSRVSGRADFCRSPVIDSVRARGIQDVNVRQSHVRIAAKLERVFQGARSRALHTIVIVAADELLHVVETSAAHIMLKPRRGRPTEHLRGCVEPRVPGTRVCCCVTVTVPCKLIKLIGVDDVTETFAQLAREMPRAVNGIVTTKIQPTHVARQVSVTQLQGV